MGPIEAELRAFVGPYLDRYQNYSWGTGNISVDAYHLLCGAGLSLGHTSGFDTLDTSVFSWAMDGYTDEIFSEAIEAAEALGL